MKRRRKFLRLGGIFTRSDNELIDLTPLAVLGKRAGEERRQQTAPSIMLSLK